MQTKTDFYPARQKHGKRINVFAVIRYTVLILVGLIMLFPTVIMVTSSLKSYDEYYAVTFRFLPANIIAGFDNYARVFSTNDQMLRWIWNTVILMVTNTAICTISTIFVAYGFAKFRSKIADLLFIVLLATMMIPWAVTMIPSFMIWARLGLTDTFIPLIIPSIGGSAYYVFMFKQNMRGIPNSIIEAAEIDGANSLIRLFKIIVPNCMPAIVTMVIFTIMGIWGDYLGPLIYLRSPEKFNISMGLNMLRTQSNQGKEDTPMLLAASVLMAIPSIILYFLGTRIFSKGISLQGGVKG